ncbi:hypothetical protein T4A_1710 [Trichinella pseudospiralis]|uniref:Uncharacterized protein n=1 Tax=Trichinella pseudospiralis TaxID=6337 RepID=A0A0V1EY31_TRIPS|nr:hypothetical protein T4A_1710 [Trichinella pseudospiralis]
MACRTSDILKRSNKAEEDEMLKQWSVVFLVISIIQLLPVNILLSHNVMILCISICSLHPFTCSFIYDHLIWSFLLKKERKIDRFLKITKQQWHLIIINFSIKIMQLIFTFFNSCTATSQNATPIVDTWQDVASQLLTDEKGVDAS